MKPPAAARNMPPVRAGNRANSSGGRSPGLLRHARCTLPDLVPLRHLRPEGLQAPKRCAHPGAARHVRGAEQPVGLAKAAAKRLGHLGAPTLVRTLEMLAPGRGRGLGRVGGTLRQEGDGLAPQLLLRQMVPTRREEQQRLAVGAEVRVPDLPSHEAPNAFARHARQSLLRQQQSAAPPNPQADAVADARAHLPVHVAPGRIE